MREIRTVLILMVGGSLVFLTYKSRYQIDILISVIWVLAIVIGLVLLLWTLAKDINRYREERHIYSFSLTALCLIFFSTVLIIEYQIQRQFNKSTLLKVYHDGDINGTGIDFKKDGTYIFDNSAMGMTDYKYGGYQISEDIITLDRSKIDNVVETSRFRIVDSNGKNDGYLIQIDSKGEALHNATEFRITADNR